MSSLHPHNTMSDPVIVSDDKNTVVSSEMKTNVHEAETVTMPQTTPQTTPPLSTSPLSTSPLSTSPLSTSPTTSTSQSQSQSPPNSVKLWFTTNPGVETGFYRHDRILFLNYLNNKTACFRLPKFDYDITANCKSFEEFKLNYIQLMINDGINFISATTRIGIVYLVTSTIAGARQHNNQIYIYFDHDDCTLEFQSIDEAHMFLAHLKLTLNIVTPV